MADNRWLWFVGVIAFLYLIAPGKPLGLTQSVVSVDQGQKMLLTVQLQTHPVDGDASDGFTTMQEGRWELTDQNKTKTFASFGPRKTDGLFEAVIDYSPEENSLLYAEIVEKTFFFNTTDNSTSEVKKEVVASTTQLILVKQKLVPKTLPASTALPVTTSVPLLSPVVEESPGFFSTYFPYVALTFGVMALGIALFWRRN